MYNYIIINIYMYLNFGVIMKTLFTALVCSFMAATVNAEQASVPDTEHFDCNFAAETALHAVENKASGVTINEFLKHAGDIPPSYEKEFYINFTALGYRYDNQQEAFDAAYQMCKTHKAKA